MPMRTSFVDALANRLPVDGVGESEGFFVRVWERADVSGAKAVPSYV